ncbi:ssDNA binding protein [Bacillus phage vB_Bpu_PumA1]|uniref:SsDNA binding protein n=1 Tax=Bacillus phage vB_Bpu_PumA1 TaxID=2662127 RepID=A0A5Q2WA83_9CAUD|nr:single strand DNA binding protein [Bacillus phage vB_Bpu_PumA1]QGH74203.1 ssDNA binding protein [Bacillus phage vB_Bpu_PumA1]
MAKENKNEIVNPEEVEQLNVQTIVEEDDKYIIYKDENGKFKRKKKYNQYFSFEPKDRQEKIELFNLMDGEDSDREDVKSMNDSENAVIEVSRVIFNPYDKINEDTGFREFGVITYLFDDTQNLVYVTSSKSANHTLNEFFQKFEYPHEEGYVPVKVQVKKKPAPNGTGKQVILKIVG